MRYGSRVALLLTFVLTGVTASLVASNMGFLVWQTLLGPAPGVSANGINVVNLPYQRDDDLDTARDLMTDIGFASVINVQRFLEPTSGLQVYTGRKGSGPDFPLVSGECYFVRVGVNTDYLMGGSSIAGVVLALDEPGAANPQGTNFVSLPYHSIADTAGDLMADIGLANVANVQRYVSASNALQIYTGRKGSGPDFPLNPTECYFVRMNTTVMYVPSHY